MDLLVARILDGTMAGVVYGFLGLAMVCVYRGTGNLNLAQGELAMFCTFVGYAFATVGVPLVVAIALAVVAGVVLGGVVERVLIRPQGRGHEAHYLVLLVGIGLFVMLNAAAGMIWGGEPLAFPALVPNGADDYVPILGQRLPYQQLLVGLMMVAVLGLLYALFRFTRIGLAMRASATNPDSALLVGVRVGRVDGLGWMLAGGVGALLGCLIAPSTTVSSVMMLNFILYACAAATLGGFESPGGTVLAGIIIGISETLLSGYVPVIGSDLKQAVALVFLLVILMVKPAGLFGSPRVERV